MNFSLLFVVCGIVLFCFGAALGVIIQFTKLNVAKSTEESIQVVLTSIWLLVCGASLMIFAIAIKVLRS
jgi:hypothetical protein